LDTELSADVAFAEFERNGVKPTLRRSLITNDPILAVKASDRRVDDTRRCTLRPLIQ
jgi:hypothetical protein